KQLRICKYPFTKDNLLLITAAQVTCLLMHAWRLNRHLLSKAFGFNELLMIVHQIAFRYFLQASKRDIALNILHKNKTVLLAILCYVGNTVLDRLRNGIQPERLSVLRQLPANFLTVAFSKQAHRKF